MHSLHVKLMYRRIRPFACILLLLPATARGQFVVGAEGINIGAGTILSADSLVLQPDAQLILASNELQRSRVPVGGSAGSMSIRRVYRFKSPVQFTGTIGMYYTQDELAANMESGLRLTLDSDSGWVFVHGSAVNTGTNLVSSHVSGAYLSGITATSSQTPLPVTLLGFTAERLTGHRALLRWETSMEEHLDRYEILRSTDGSSFHMIGTVTAAGSRNYAYTDDQPANGHNYYRLSIRDKNGTTAYSPIRHVVFQPEGTSWRIAPNPVADKLVINTVTRPSETAVIVYNAAGQLMGRYTLMVPRTVIETSTWPAGFYLLYIGREAFKIEKR